jgi:hypothetical protein
VKELGIQENDVLIVEVPDFKKGKGRFKSSLANNTPKNNDQLTDFVRTFSLFEIKESSTEEELDKFNYLKKHQVIEALLGPKKKYALGYNL